jgi:hypothetical protein
MLIGKYVLKCRFANPPERLVMFSVLMHKK